LAGFVNHAHASTAYFFEQLVIAEAAGVRSFDFRFPISDWRVGMASIELRCFNGTKLSEAAKAEAARGIGSQQTAALRAAFCGRHIGVRSYSIPRPGLAVRWE